MKLLPSDPDIETIVARIRRGDLDLQPDFQRGEVWSDSKKRRLIDTILRDWHIPPLHVIERPHSHKQEVLDGQQRLVAIRDFVNGKLTVDATIAPIDIDIVSAHARTYEALPAELKRRFDRFTIRVFRLVDFQPDEPGELFFRLNQPTSLTSAEQRNAFFGPVREQIRTLCKRFPEFGLKAEFLGFSNSRMAYDDTLAKLCLALEVGSLREKSTASTITERYRRSDPLPGEITTLAETALRTLAKGDQSRSDKLKFNKATLFSWLCFITRVLHHDHCNELVSLVPQFLAAFEEERSGTVEAFRTRQVTSFNPFPAGLLHVFTDRASLRVTDVSSVLLRDAILAFCFWAYFRAQAPRDNNDNTPFEQIFSAWSPLKMGWAEADETILLQKLDAIKWGKLP